MHALIFDTDPTAMVRQAAILMDKGFHVSCAESPATARAFLSSGTVDLLIAGATGPGMTDRLRAMLPVSGNADMAILVIGEVSATEFQSLSSGLPGFYGMIGRASGPDVLTQLAVSAVDGIDLEQGHRRRQRFVAAAMAALSQRAKTVSSASAPAAPTRPARPDPVLPSLEDWAPVPASAPVVEKGIIGPLAPPNRDPMPDRRLHLS